MLNFTIYTADCVGNSGNCLYPNKMIVTDKESFIKATKMDHVTAKYKGNYRSKDNFEFSDCIPLDCDNDHSDNPNEWVTPLDIALEIPGVAFAVSYSRHHNLPKGDKSARPRFHIFFPMEIVSNEQEYADMKRRIADAFPYYDTNALDSARFLYGNDSDEVEFYEGDKTILDYLEEDEFADFDASLEQVPEGQRNSTMSHIAGKIIKRYGNTEDAYRIFLKKAELCNPPLPESELKVIWRSASKFGNKVSNQEGCIPPEQYNSDCRLKPEDFSDVGQATVLATEYVTEVIVSGNATVSLQNDYMPVIPVVTTTAETKLTWKIGTDTFNKTVSAGTWEFPELQLSHGTNSVKVTGSGTTTFRYREGCL